MLEDRNMTDKRKKHPADRGATQITFLATDEIRDTLDLAAKRAGYSTRTAYMIQVLLRDARRVLKQP